MVIFLAWTFGRVQGVCLPPPGGVLLHIEDVRSGKPVLSAVEGNNAVITRKNRQKHVRIAGIQSRQGGTLLEFLPVVTRPAHQADCGSLTRTNAV